MGHYFLIHLGLIFYPSTCLTDGDDSLSASKELTVEVKRSRSTPVSANAVDIESYFKRRDPLFDTSNINSNMRTVGVGSDDNRWGQNPPNSTGIFDDTYFNYGYYQYSPYYYISNENVATLENGCANNELIFKFAKVVQLLNSVVATHPKL
jgi:hypothetical protein